jgi:hypothetical protein
MKVKSSTGRHEKQVKEYVGGWADRKEKPEKIGWNRWETERVH